VSIPLHHVVEGPSTAPVLLLGNSLGAATAMWDPVMPRLRDRVRAVRFDHRGQGASPVPHGPYELADLGEDVLALLDDLEIERASYAGVSIAGMVGLWLAAHAPDRIDRLAVFCTTAHLDDADAYAQRAEAVLRAGSTAPIADAVVSRWTTPAFAREHPGAVADLKAMLLASPPDGYAACCGVLERLDLRPDLERVRAPTLVVAGAGDAAIAPEHGQRIAAAVPGARFVLMDDAAHIPMAERPAAVAHLILEHLEAPV
jgi:3-oxoadipate enol-lactonase